MLMLFNATHTEKQQKCTFYDARARAIRNNLIKSKKMISFSLISFEMFVFQRRATEARAVKKKTKHSAENFTRSEKFWEE
jgi:hypothetical protein